MAKVKNSCGGTTCIVDPIAVAPVEGEKTIAVVVKHGFRLFLGGETYSYPQELTLPESVYTEHIDRVVKLNESI